MADSNGRVTDSFIRFILVFVSGAAVLGVSGVAWVIASLSSLSAVAGNTSDQLVRVERTQEVILTQVTANRSDINRIDQEQQFRGPLVRETIRENAEAIKKLTEAMRSLEYPWSVERDEWIKWRTRVDALLEKQK